MTRHPYLLSIDQGTTSTRAIVFDLDGASRAVAQRELPQIFPEDGWVEHDPEEIWRATREVSAAALSRAGAGADEVAAIGITNQRETTIVWERATGRPIHNAIVWQDRRTAEHCRRLAADGHETAVREKTGLLIDPYFSASKIVWLLDNVDGARGAAERGELAFGTVDCFLLWRLTGGRVHATDATNASRTMIFNIHTQDWDDDLLDVLDIPRSILPEVGDSSGEFGIAEAAVLGFEVPVSGIAGDQQAATVGQACFVPGMTKSTYGTGCFALLNTGETVLESKNRLLSTVAYRLDGKTTYAIEGSIFAAGASWPRVRSRQTRMISRSTMAVAVSCSLPSKAGCEISFSATNRASAEGGPACKRSMSEASPVLLLSRAYSFRRALVAPTFAWRSRATTK